MIDWKPGDRVVHPAFGTGTVLECNAQHTVIHFDQGGRRKFATAMVALSASPTPSPSAATGRPVLRTTPYPVVRPAPVPALQDGVPSTIDQLLDLARRKVEDENSLNQFVSTMRKTLPGPSHQYVGLLSGMRVQQFQHWLFDVNPQHQLTDAQLLAVLRVEFPLAGAELFTGDVDTGLRHISTMRADYNRDGHNGPSPTSRGMPYSVSYGRFRAAQNS
jgi:hypothetical protein